jgi:hypothetical protein
VKGQSASPYNRLTSHTSESTSRPPSASLANTLFAPTRWLSRPVALISICAAIAVGELIVLALLSQGIEASFRFGPIRISAREFDNPLIIGVVASIVLLVAVWHRVWWRRMTVALIASLGLVAVVAYGRQASAITAVSDIAVGELYTLLAAEGRQLLGPYSRFNWHHPGPLLFWIEAPFYRLSGYRTAALYSGALAINLTALATLAWVVAREDRRLAALVTGASLLFAWHIPTLFANPWNALVPALSSLTFVVLCAAVANGRIGLLPLMVVFGSFITQTHLGYAPLVGVLSPVSLAIGLPVYRSRTGRPLWPHVVASSWLALGLWLFPIAEQLSQEQGNVTRLWRFFGAETAPGVPFGDAYANWAFMIVGVLRPDDIPYGGHFAPTHLVWGMPLAGVEMAMLLAVALRAFRTSRTFMASLAVTMFVASMVGLWSITRIREDVLAYHIFWLAGVGAINAAVIVAAVIQAFEERFSPHWIFDGRLASLVCAVTIGAGVWLGVRDLRHLTGRERDQRRTVETVDSIYRSVREYLNFHQLNKPLLRVDNRFYDLGAATLVRLRKAGVQVAVDDDWVWMYTDTFRVSGDEDAVVSIATPATHPALIARPGNVVLLDRDPVFVDALAITRDPNR